MHNYFKFQKHLNDCSEEGWGLLQQVTFWFDELVCNKSKLLVAARPLTSTQLQEQPLYTPHAHPTTDIHTASRTTTVYTTRTRPTIDIHTASRTTTVYITHTPDHWHPPHTHQVLVTMDVSTSNKLNQTINQARLSNKNNNNYPILMSLLRRWSFVNACLYICYYWHKPGYHTLISFKFCTHTPVMCCLWCKKWKI